MLNGVHLEEEEEKEKGFNNMVWVGREERKRKIKL
jgi:hypothetical protein